MKSINIVLGVFIVVLTLSLLSLNFFLGAVFGLAFFVIFGSLKKLKAKDTNIQKDIDLPKHSVFNRNVGILNYDKLNNLKELPNQFAVIDVETTGLNHLLDKIIEIAIIHVKDGEVVDRFSQLINPGRLIPYEASRINGITDFMVKSQPKIDEVINEIHSRISMEPLIVGYNVEFDLKFINVALAQNGLCISSVSYFDVLNLTRQTLSRVLPNHKLETVKKYFDIENASHRAISDCEVTLEVFKRCLEIKMGLHEQYKQKQEKLISKLNENEKLFISTLQDKLQEKGITSNFSYNILSNGIINFTIDGKQIGRVKLSGRKYKMQILDGNNVLWLDIDDVSEAIGNIKHWLNYADKLIS